MSETTRRSLALHLRSAGLLGGGWVLGALLGLALSLLLSACGGASGSGGQTPTPDPDPSTQGALTVSLVGGLPGGLNHVWVTVTGVALQTAVDVPFGADSSWQSLPLAAPITVDLAQLAQGGSLTILVSTAVPVGSYRQLRLLLAAHDAALLDSARNMLLADGKTSAGLTHNLEIEQTLDDGSTQRVALESAGSTPSLTAKVSTLTVTTSTVVNVALQWGADEAARPAGAGRWLLGGQLQGYDLDKTGSIIGGVDLSQVCGVEGAPVDCASRLEVHAVAASEDGSHLRWWRSVPVNSQGGFTLYPLPPLTRFDVLLQGRNMKPQRIRDVPVTLDFSVPAVVGGQGHLLKPTLSTAAHAVQLDSAGPVGVQQVLRVQSLTGELPMQRAAGVLDLLSGVYPAAALWGDSDWEQAPWNNDQNWTLSAVTPVEGAGGGRALFPASATVLGGLGSAQSPGTGNWALPALQRPTGVSLRPVTVTLGAGGQPAQALLVVGDASGVVLVRDVSSQIRAGGGSVNLQLPAGAGSGFYDTVALRSWKAAAPLTSVQWVRAAAALDLRRAASGSLSLAAP